MTKEEIIKAAEMCCHNGCSVDCPLMAGGESCREVFTKYILEQENEPAPQEAETSSQKKYLQGYNNAKLRNCQDRFEYSLECLNLMFEGLSGTEKAAWSLGKMENMLEELRLEIKEGY